MGYTFARVGAVIQLNVENYYIQNRRRWLRLHEKGGKVNELPCHHNLQIFLDEWVANSGLAAASSDPLFPTMRHGKLTGQHPMARAETSQMIRRRAAAAGVATQISCHSFRATGITVYLQNGGKLEVAQQMAGHESSRTTGLYDRRDDTVALDEVERVVFLTWESQFASLRALLNPFVGNLCWPTFASRCKSARTVDHRFLLQTARPLHFHSIRDTSRVVIMPSMKVVSPDRKRAYAVMNQLIAVDLERKRIIKTVDLERTRYVANISRDGKRLFVSGAAPYIHVYDTDTLNLIKTIELAGDPALTGFRALPSGAK